MIPDKEKRQAIAWTDLEKTVFRHLSFIMFTENKPDYVLHVLLRLKAQLHMQQDHSDKHNYI